MKKLIIFGILLLGIGVSKGYAQASTVQVLEINISEMSVINTNGILSFNFTSLTAGQDPEPLTATTTYSISTNGSNKKITAEIDSPLPNGINMEVEMSAPAGAVSSGPKTLSTLPTDMVTGISRMRGELLDVGWNVDITVDAVPGTYSRWVTFTITNN